MVIKTPGYEHVARNVLRWDDLRFPAVSINPPGQVSDPDFDTTNGGYLFNPTGTEVLFIAAQLPHAWMEQSSITPHVHWQKSTSASGDVMWRWDLKWAPINGVMDAAWTTQTTATVLASTPDTDTADKHLITAFTDVDCSGREVSDMMVMRISRLGDDVADTYGDQARLLEFDIHYIVDGLGSEVPFDKFGISR